MLSRKIENEIVEYLVGNPNKILIVDGARQIGKSYIIRHIGKRTFPNYIELNMEEDKLGDRLFANVHTIQDFYLAVSIVAGEKMGSKNDTLIFIDEIQAYEHLITLLKFLRQDGRFRYIASGSLLGVSLRNTSSIPMGAIDIKHMYPLDFEEFLWANGIGTEAIDNMRRCFTLREDLSDAIHDKVMDLFRKYLVVGGMPEAVTAFIEQHNVVRIRDIQTLIHNLYKTDAAKYEQESLRKLKIERIYDMIPSVLEQVKKRIVLKDIEGKEYARMAQYVDEFEYLISSGIALEAKAISKPTYPLIANSGKNLLKLYLNDVGLLTSLYYGTSVQAILQNHPSVNLGAVYETAVAQELTAHGFRLHYYDNKKNGEVDFLIDDNENLSVLPIEVKSGRDYKIHNAINRFVATKEYNIHNAIVLSNERHTYTENGITYLPIYHVMFISAYNGDTYI